LTPPLDQRTIGSDHCQVHLVINIVTPARAPCSGLFSEQPSSGAVIAVAAQRGGICFDPRTIDSVSYSASRPPSPSPSTIFTGT